MLRLGLSGLSLGQRGGGGEPVELLTNGGFDTDLSGWATGFDSAYGTFSSTGGKLRIVLTGTGGVTRRPRLVQNAGITPGNYTLTVTGITKSSAFVLCSVGSASNGTAGVPVYDNQISSGVPFAFSVAATGTYVSVGAESSTDGGFIEIDTISLVRS